MPDLSRELQTIEMSVILDSVRDLDDPDARRRAYLDQGVDEKSIDQFDAQARRYAINTRKLFGDAFGKEPS